MTPNRLAEGYQPEFDIDAEVGRQGELFVLNLIEAFKDGRGEVKADAAAVKYRNAYIEFACLKRGSYEPSSIDTSTSDYWAIAVGDPPIFAVIAPTELVRRVKEKAVREGLLKSCLRGSHPTQGVVIPLAKLLNWLLDAHLQAEREAA